MKNRNGTTTLLKDRRAMVRNAKRKRRVGPNRIDPTRTQTLRRAFAQSLRKRFARIRYEIAKLVVEEDAFGLKEAAHTVAALTKIPRMQRLVIENAFCPTGPGGGIDPTCSPGAGLAPRPSGRSGKLPTARLKAIAAAKYGKLEKRYGPKYAKAIIGAAMALAPTTTVSIVAVAEMHRMASKVLARNATDDRDMTEAEIEEAARKLLEELEEEAGAGENGEQIANAFCPTGEGGGIDPTCSPGSSKSEGEKPPLKVTVKGEIVEVATNPSRESLVNWIKRTHSNQLLGLVVEGKILVFDGETDTGEKVYHEDIYRFITGKTDTPAGEHRFVITQMKGGPRVHSYSTRSEVVKAWGDSIGIVVNTRWRFQADAEKITAFQQWLKGQLAKHLIGRTEEELWQRYVEAGFKKGAGRAFDDVKQSKLRKEKPELFTPEAQGSLRDFYAGSKDEFLRSAFGRPEAVEKVKLLAGRSFDDLENVTADMSARISRSLTDGLVEGKGPLEIARDMAKDVNLSRDRAELIARTEIIRAHAEGQLAALEDLGVEEVGVAVEFTVTDDNVLCPRCEALEGVVLTVEEAHGIIPVHPNCRCAFLPANVGESDKDRKDQTRSKAAIEKAAEEADVELEVSKRRPEEFVANWRGFRHAINGWHPLVNAFCPTGEGGGIDPTCPSGKEGKRNVGDVQTKTPQFKRWFGESKVVDDDGNPLVVFHGTTKDVKSFSTKKIGVGGAGSGSGQKAFWFTDSPEVAESYVMTFRYDRSTEKNVQAGWQNKANVIAAYLKLENPLITTITKKDEDAGMADWVKRKSIERAVENGNDGVIFKSVSDSMRNVVDRPTNIYAVFKPTQIKSAIGNRGTFDPSSPSIVNSGDWDEMVVNAGWRPL